MLYEVKNPIFGVLVPLCIRNLKFFCIHVKFPEKMRLQIFFNEYSCKKIHIFEDRFFFPFG